MPLFGKNKTTVVNGVVTLVKDIRGMVDDSKFTNQEKSRFELSLADSVVDFAKATLSENTDRSKTRRQIAIVSVYFFYFLIIALLILWKLDPLWYKAAKELIIEFKLPTAFIMIMAFFFGGYYVNKFLGGKTPKEDKKV